MQMNPPKSGLFRRTPPAIFPPIFGLFGLGLAWRRAADGFAVSPAFGDLILGAVTLLYLFAVVAYGVKILRRPGAFMDDLKTLPGRAGLTAMSLSGMLFAASTVSYSVLWAQVILAIALLVHLFAALTVARAILGGPPEARHVTPVWHLLFVGFIISPLAALPLGYHGYSMGIYAVTFVVAFLIWGVSLGQLVRKAMPAPLRPVLAIHLAPASLLGIVSYMLGNATIGFAFGILALIIFTGLLVRIRWVIQAGFSPFWGAFTFPLAAFSSLMQIIAAAGHGPMQGEIFRILGGASLMAATIIIPIIAWKILQLWAKGVLAVKTNAAEA